MIGKIAVSAANFAIDKPYSYFVPDTMALQPGMRVQVPFGRSNRRTEGILLALEDGDPDGLKAIDCCLDEEPLLSPVMLRLAAFLRERYFCTYFDGIRAMLPAGLWFRTLETYTLTEDRSWQDKKLRVPGAQQLLQLLQDGGGTGTGEILRQTLEPDIFERAIRYLSGKKWVTASKNFVRRTGDKTEKIATLAVSGEEAMAYAQGRPKSAAMQRAVLELMCAVGAAAVKEICYYTGASQATVKKLAEQGYLALSEREVLRCRQVQPVKVDEELVLNQEQQTAFDGLCQQMTQEHPGTALLHGVTGSGKTAVYIRLIRQCLEQGKQALLLVPEIALTPQLLGLMAGGGSA